jgi:hypothetical protein
MNEMNTFWQQFLATLGGFAVVTAAVAWLTKALIAHWMSKDIENHKERLRTTTAKELEILRHDLATAAKEHEVTFSRLHEKRALVIQEFYAQINRLERALSDFEFSIAVVGDSSLTDPGLASDLSEYYRNNRIFLTPDLCNMIDELIQSIRGPMVTYTYVDHSLPPEQRAKRFADAKAEAGSRAAATKRAVEAEFRSLLGVAGNPNRV